MNGQIIMTSAIQEAFWEWIEGLRKKYPFVGIEYSLGQIMIVRVRCYVEDEKLAIKGQTFGKIMSDASGFFMERTFKPRYFPDKDEVKGIED